MKEEYKDKFHFLLNESPILFVAVLWSIVAIMTQRGIIGLIGLAILYRRYRYLRVEE